MRSSSWRSSVETTPLVRVLTMVIFLRYLLMPGIGFFVNTTFPLEGQSDFTVFERPDPFWDMFARYDSGWYYTIAHEGYHYDQDAQSNMAFFPLYPLAMRGLGWIFGGEQPHYYLAGMLVSRLAFLAAMVVLYHLARMDLDIAGAERAVLYTAVFPFALFYSRVYSESLFLLLTVLSMYFFRTHKWEWGGITGALASLTRVNGILSIPALAWIAATTPEIAERRRWARPALALLAVAGGLGLFCAYSYQLTGSPLAWVHAIGTWNNYRPGGAPWTPLVALARQLVRRPLEFLTSDPNGPYDTLNGMTAMVFVLSIPFVWRRLGAAYGLHMTANLWVPLSSGQFEGLGRYCAVLFPFFVWLASFRSTLLRDMVLTSFIAWYVVCLAYFIKLHPIF